MKTLFLLRHAKSDWSDPSLDDFERPLNRRGQAAAPLIGAYLDRQGLPPDLVLCSSATRARQTCALAVHRPGRDIPVKFEKSLYLAGPSTILRRLHRLPDGMRSVMLIAHNPGMHSLALKLIDARLPGDTAAPGDTASLAVLRSKYPTAGLIELTFDMDAWSEMAAGTGTLVRFIRPKDLT